MAILVAFVPQFEPERNDGRTYDLCPGFTGQTLNGDELGFEVGRLQDGPLEGHAGEKHLVPADRPLVIEEAMVGVRNAAVIERLEFKPAFEGVNQDRLKDGIGVECFTGIG